MRTIRKKLLVKSLDFISYAYPDTMPNDYQIGEIVDHLVHNRSDFSDYYCRLTYGKKKSFIRIIKRFLRLKKERSIQ